MELKGTIWETICGYHMMWGNRDTTWALLNSKAAIHHLVSPALWKHLFCAFAGIGLLADALVLSTLKVTFIAENNRVRFL